MIEDFLPIDRFLVFCQILLLNWRVRCEEIQRPSYQERLILPKVEFCFLALKINIS